MKEHLKRIIEGSEMFLKAPNTMREYLQARLLACLQREGAMIPLAFHDGTALRFLYALPRYSEDLDFAMERNPNAYDLRHYIRAFRWESQREGQGLETRVSEERSVRSAWPRFQGPFCFEMGPF